MGLKEQQGRLGLDGLGESVLGPLIRDQWTKARGCMVMVQVCAH